MMTLKTYSLLLFCTFVNPSHLIIPHCNKLRSINLLFSIMLCIKRKIIRVGTKKIILLFINNKYTLKLKIGALLLMTHKKFGKNYCYRFIIQFFTICRVFDCGPGGCQFVPHLCCKIYSRYGPSAVKLHSCGFLGTLYVTLA